MKNNIKIVINAPVIIAFALLCVIATILISVTNGRAGVLLFTTYHSSLLSPLTWIRFVTHIFGHIGWEHLIGNMMYLLLIGPMLEEKYKSRTLAAVMAITAVITGIINYIFFPGVALCGASGIVFAFILLSSFTKHKKREIPLTFILVAILFLGQQIYEGIVIEDNISNMSHIVGGIIGGLVGYKLNK